MDFADHAAALSTAQLSTALNSRHRFDGISETECQNCGFDIPEQRRKLGNVKLCIDCQTDAEKRLKHYNRGSF